MQRKIHAWLVTAATCAYGFAPLAGDINRTHLLHPDWMPHARFHMAWLLGTSSLLALVALWCLWVKKDLALSVSIGLGVMGGFWIAAAGMALYAGQFADPGGRPLEFFGVDANAFVFGILTAVLVLTWLHHRLETA